MARSVGKRWINWSVAWSNPHTPRPEGMPEEILRVREYRESTYPCPPDVDDCWEEMRHYGYCVRVWTEPGQPPKRWSLERKQRMRRRNLWHRLMKRYPLFAADWYAEQLAARPEYYGAFVADEFLFLSIRYNKKM